ncbi:TonB-dependent receptor [Ilyomonas limi]|uniref:TonB-dependent receptor n=1 Tax=Ilyomonas limi TaxID=2575867 RepID=A0A4U3L413_9BACT|nr:TonB-dependent receptor [Ilyomonas limi]TKK69825.1 TonB-dependent receptor [Ilyomonas limi]
MTSKSILIITAFIAVCFSLHAQDSLYNQLNEVVVTANRYEQKQNTTGKVVTVINKEIIEKSSGKTVAQLLNEQAGVVINGALNNMGSVQTVYMRGASSGRALILLDGVPVNDPSMINNEFDLNMFSLNDVERIEICRGAQSTLYGSDAVAGVINIITVKKDVTKAFNGAATVSAGNYGMLKGNTQLYGKAGKFNYTVRYARLHTNGFSSATDTITTPHRKFDSDEYDGENVNAQLSYQATPALTVKAFALYSKYQAGIDAGVFRDDEDYTIHNKSFTGGAGFTFKKNIFSINGNYQYSELNRRYLNDSLDKTNVDFENNTYGGKNQFVELFGNVALGKHFTLVAGGDYRFSSFNKLYFSISGFGPYADTFPSSSINQKSVYASVIFKGIDDRLNIELGGRINKHSIYGTNKTYTFNPSFSITDWFRIFGSISTGYKAPGIYQLFDQFSGNKNLQPETSKNYEAGVALQKEKINARAVFFNRDINNGIDYNYVTYQYFNYVRQKVDGIELEITAKPAKAVTLSANYTFISPHETSQNRKTNLDTVTYNYLLRRPAHDVNLTVGVQLAKPLYISVNGKYVSKRYDVGGYMQPDVTLKGYFLVGAYAEYKLSSQVKFFADAKNLFNTRFYDVYGYNSIPFLLNAGVTFSF